MCIAVSNHVTQSGQGASAILFAHGFGCDQRIWRAVAPAFEADYRVLRFDHAGCGGSLAAWNATRHADLHGYARDVLELCQTLELENVIYVGHSVSGMIGLLAAAQAPERFAQLVLIGASPRYVDDAPKYRSAFRPDEIMRLLALLEEEGSTWPETLAAMMVGTDGQTMAAKTEMADQFRATECAVARHFGRVTFTADHRADIRRARTPTLLMQCADDLIVPDAVADYLHEHLVGSTLRRMRATGHCPHLTHPEETIAVMRSYLANAGRP